MAYQDWLGAGTGRFAKEFIESARRMTDFIVENKNTWMSLMDHLMGLRDQGGKWTVKVEPYKRPRTDGQNSRYWASLTEYLKQIAAAVARVSDQTGYTPIEVKRLIAKNMQPEHGLILFAHKPEIAHEVLKEIVGIPTSTRLGTKEFMAFDGRMEQVIAEIAGEVNAFERAI